MKTENILKKLAISGIVAEKGNFKVDRGTFEIRIDIVKSINPNNWALDSFDDIKNFILAFCRIHQLNVIRKENFMYTQYIAEK